MRYPWANLLLLLFLLLQAVTGYFGFVNGMEGRAWLLWLHAIGAYAITLLLFWKGAIIWQVARRGVRWRGERLLFLFLLALLLTVLGLGITWTFAGYERVGGFSLLSLHIYLALPLLAIMGWHAWRRRWILRRPETWERRTFLRTGLAAVGGAFLWGLLQNWQRLRRFTGSYEIGSFSRFFPRVSWIDDRPDPVDLAHWQLQISGLVERPLQLTYNRLRELAQSQVTATLDCTGGWYTVQEWQGLPLAGLLLLAGVQSGARTVRVQSVTGYWRRFSLAEAEQCLLALQVAGEPLGHGHGAPLRLVAPGHRGFEWVKWITEIELEAISPAWQPPLPLQ